MKKRVNYLMVMGVCIALAMGMTVSGCGMSDFRALVGLSEQTEEQTEELQPEEIQTEEMVVEEDEIPETEEIEAIEIPKELPKTITITATGDCTFGKTQDHGYDGSFLSYYDAKGPDYFFSDVKDVFEQDDLTLINLECVLTTSDAREDKTFNLKGKPEYVAIMTGSSIEACSMGNNHTYDYGEAGFQETEGVLDEAGISFAHRDRTAVYETEDGVKIGLVSASLLSLGSDRTDRMKDQIAQLREDGADLIIASCHWGIEKQYYANEYQIETAHGLIDAGADLVIGNHPHVLQGVEVYNGRVICYSLGNFCFGGNLNPSDKNTMMFQQTFTIENGEVDIRNLDAKIIPCRLSSHDGYNDFHPVKADGERWGEIIEKVNAYSESFGDVNFDSEGTLLQ